VRIGLSLEGGAPSRTKFNIDAIQHEYDGGKPMPVDSLEKLLFNELKDLYSAEHQITKALPKMVAAVDSEELKEALESHLEETEEQIVRLDKIGTILGKSLKGKTCEGMKGVLLEGSETLQELPEGSVRDAGAISAAQRVEHYEMAAYGAVREYAQLLGMDDVVALLEETLNEEKAADEKLTKIAKSVNSEAMSAAA
jgi:ferritin-like metal-binding protein YciE